ncbi:MAG: tetratricopeptide repeat protein [candidate division WOR-3 bacterium]
MKEIKEDKLQDYVAKFFSLYYRDRQKFLIIVGGFVAVIVVLIFFLSSKPKENPEVSVRFTEALGFYSTGNLGEAEGRFLEITRRFPNQKLGVKAQFYLANIYFQTQKYDEARQAFTQFYNKNKKDPLLSPSSLLGIANCYEEVKEYKKAGETYEKVAQEYKKSPFAPHALLAAARCYKNLGNYKKAKEVYEKFLKDYPNDIAKDDAKAGLSYVNTLLEKKRLR